jgi:hypothetical protein
VTERLPVHINREGVHSLEVPASFETSDSFVISLDNHGEGLHVHLHLDDDLSDIADLEANNHYVEANATRDVKVALMEPGETLGKLKIASAYGAETRYVDVEISEPERQTQPVEVDTSLSQPKPKHRTTSEQEGLLDGTGVGIDLQIFALGLGALFVATLTAAVIGSFQVFLGALLVFSVVLVGGYYLVSDDDAGSYR